MMNSNELGRLIEEVYSIAEKLSKYSNYPPVYNSKKMLQDISEHMNDKDYLKSSQPQLNVGLLAAKAFDFEKDGDSDLYAYQF